MRCGQLPSPQISRHWESCSQSIIPPAPTLVAFMDNALVSSAANAPWPQTYNEQSLRHQTETTSGTAQLPPTTVPLFDSIQSLWPLIRTLPSSDSPTFYLFFCHVLCLPLRRPPLPSTPHLKSYCSCLAKFLRVATARGVGFTELLLRISFQNIPQPQDG